MPPENPLVIPESHAKAIFGDLEQGEAKVDAKDAYKQFFANDVNVLRRIFLSDPDDVIPMLNGLKKEKPGMLDRFSTWVPMMIKRMEL